MLVLAGNSAHVHILTPKKELYWKSTYTHTIEDAQDTGCEVNSVAWSPQDPLFALCGKKWEHIYLINCSSLQNVVEERLKIPRGKFQNCCCFGGSGDALASVGVSGLIFIWKRNIASGLWSMVGELANLTPATATTISWDPTSRFLCTGNTKGHVTVHLCDVTTLGDDVRGGDEVKKKKALSNSRLVEEVTALQCNPYFPSQPAEVSVGHGDGTLVVWDIATGKPNFRLRSHKTMVTDIAYSTINGMLLVTTSLDGELHLVSVKEGNVIKKLCVGKPVYSAEFVRDQQAIVFLTEENLLSYNLREPWSNRKSEQHPHFRFARYRSSRCPIEESQKAYLSRSSQNRSSENRQSLSKDEMNSLRAKSTEELSKVSTTSVSQNATHGSVESISQYATRGSQDSASQNTTRGSQDSASQNATGGSQDSAPQNATRGSQEGRLRNKTLNISDIEEEDDDLFNISDIANYTAKGEEISQVAAHQKRPASDDLKTHDPSTPISLDEKTHKMRRMDDGGKENCPPCRIPRLIASTPEVSSNKASNFGTPTSKRADSFKRTPTATNSAGGRVSFLSDDHYSPHSLISSLGADSHNLSVTDLSQKLKKMGSNANKIDCTPNSLQVPVLASNALSSGGSNFSQSNLSSQPPSASSTASSRLPTSSTAGALLNSDQMGLIQRMLEDGFKELKKELNSETRWLKNEIVKNTLQTEWNLEDGLKQIIERQSSLEERISTIEQDIAAIKNTL